MYRQQTKIQPPQRIINMNVTRTRLPKKPTTTPHRQCRFRYLFSVHVWMSLSFLFIFPCGFNSVCERDLCLFSRFLCCDIAFVLCLRRNRWIKRAMSSIFSRCALFGNQLNHNLNEHDLQIQSIIQRLHRTWCHFAFIEHNTQPPSVRNFPLALRGAMRSRLLISCTFSWHTMCYHTMAHNISPPPDGLQMGINVIASLTSLRHRHSIKSIVFDSHTLPYVWCVVGLVYLRAAEHCCAYIDGHDVRDRLPGVGMRVCVCLIPKYGTQKARQHSSIDYYDVCERLRTQFHRGMPNGFTYFIQTTVWICQNAIISIGGRYRSAGFELELRPSMICHRSTHMWRLPRSSEFDMFFRR